MKYSIYLTILFSAIFCNAQNHVLWFDGSSGHIQLNSAVIDILLIVDLILN